MTFRKTHSKRVLPCMISAVAFSASISALADEAKPLEIIHITGTQGERYGAGESGTSTGLDMAIRDTPQSITAISRAFIDDFQLTDINGVLDSVAGVNVQRVETDRFYYTARGFEVNQFQIDGIGLPLVNSNMHGSLDTATLERVEVVRGANGLMTGNGNPSATINNVRKRPGLEDETTISASLTASPAARLQLDNNWRASDELGVRSVAVIEQGDGYLDRQETTKHVLYSVLAFEPSSQLRVDLGLNYSHSRTDGNLWGALPLYYSDGSATDYDRSTSTSAEWSFWDVSVMHGFADMSYTFDNNWVASAHYQHTRTDEDSELFYVYGTPDRETEAGLTGYASEYLLDDQQEIFDARLTGDIQLGNAHQFVVGANYADLGYQDQSLYDFTNGFPPIANLNTWDGKTAQMNFSDGLDGSDVDMKQQAVYGNIRWTLSDRLRLLTGARWNQFDIEGYGYGSDKTADFTRWVPYAGLTFAVNDDLTLYSSYTETFVAQTEINLEGEPLGPLDGDQFEIGLKTDLWGDRALLSLALFDITQNNLPVCVVDCGLPQAKSVGTEVQSRGAELDLVGEINEQWQISLSAAHTRLDDNPQGLAAQNELANVHEFTPENTLAIATKYSPAAIEGLSVGGQLRWQSDIYRTQGVVADTFANAGEEIVTRQGAYGVLDITTHYAVNDNIDVRATINNVTNEKYITSLYWAQGYYGEPTNIRIGIDYRF